MKIRAYGADATLKACRETTYARRAAQRLPFPPRLQVL